MHLLCLFYFSFRSFFLLSLFLSLSFPSLFLFSFFSSPFLFFSFFSSSPLSPTNTKKVPLFQKECGALGRTPGDAHKLSAADEMDDLTQAHGASETESLLERDLVSPKLLDRSIASPNMLRSPNLLDRTPNMLGAHPAVSTTNLFVRWSIGDWSTAVLIFGLGYWADKTWLPFQRDITPQLEDPNISYPHTPNLQAQVPGPLLWHLALHLPLLLLTVLCKFWPHPATSSANERWQFLSETLLGLISSVAAALFFVSVVKVAPLHY